MEWVLVPREQLDGLVTKIGAAAHVQSPLLPEYVATLKREARAMIAAAPQAEPVAPWLPIEPDPWVRLMKLANEYAMHMMDAASHQAESRADISRTAALKTMAQMREVFFAHCREVEQGTRHACSIAVWMTLQEALAPDADDKGLDGWMREAEQRVKLGPNVPMS